MDPLGPLLGKFLRLAILALGTAGAVDFPHNDVEEYQHIDAYVEADEAEEVAGELVTLLSLLHVE